MFSSNDDDCLSYVVLCLSPVVVSIYRCLGPDPDGPPSFDQAMHFVTKFDRGLHGIDFQNVISRYFKCSLPLQEEHPLELQENAIKIYVIVNTVLLIAALGARNDINSKSFRSEVTPLPVCERCEGNSKRV